jgi:hypothetical protein
MIHNYHLFCWRIYYYRYLEYNEHIWIHDHIQMYKIIYYTYNVEHLSRRYVE